MPVGGDLVIRGPGPIARQTAVRVSEVVKVFILSNLPDDIAARSAPRSGRELCSRARPARAQAEPDLRVDHHDPQIFDVVCLGKPMHTWGRVGARARRVEQLGDGARR
jgi:hypothetical protein